ncbi:hypothetical protein [Mesorhizobium sp. KR9-304]|uniref:hypothetical protein n=1 Tax=Mesorhizobium sp. KR9-304 TaxID=3156614 RepID=UPI0032B56696
MYRSVEDEFEARPVGNSGRELVPQGGLRQGELGMFLRVACVVATIWGGSALAVWSAG